MGPLGEREKGGREGRSIGARVDRVDDEFYYKEEEAMEGEFWKGGREIR